MTVTPTWDILPVPAERLARCGAQQDAIALLAQLEALMRLERIPLMSGPSALRMAGEMMALIMDLSE